jgi:AcrR family transcriptional regulator
MATRPAEPDSMTRIVAAVEAARFGLRRERGQDRPLGRKAARTREALLAAAYDVFTTQGYQATSVNDIAAAAGVSVGTFYQYFRDRAGIMAALVGDAVVVMFGARNRWDARDGLPGVIRLVTSFVETYAGTAPFQRLWEEVTHVDAELATLRRDVTHLLTADVATELGRAAALGLVRDDLDPFTTASALTSMVDRYCYITYVFDPGPEGAPKPAEVAETLARMWAGAVGLEVAG